MLGFTLSKFSLLILVVAIFGIVSFFTLQLTESLKSKALTDMLANNASIASEMMSSPSYCDALLVKIPETVKLSTSEMYYVMRISTQPVPNSEKSYLIFSAASRASPEQTVAASSSPTTASVTIYDNSYSNPVDAQEGILLDPSARSSELSDAFYLVKEIDSQGKVLLFVFPCAISGGIQSNCRNAKKAVGSKVHASDLVKKFKCDEENE
ncbi:MAG: hypothetical protein J4478_01130 [Candidatus Diapherotrites archaeon]|uniref:Uncharacterized protein n=2 Tax=Candidatus Iainarchaeum sp. TaxID=3101447 RepID=A0A7J4JVM7_9ARCH|nr:MAG: hypothetical protein QT12_C0018G0003 [archaeon GW2011_AR21]MBS3057987.1 hypothetical protein [Candidatus Diapherotrites archaeon]HIH21832.1 hypothetical protein [Candidatus Diapherotrites archaeon]